MKAVSKARTENIPSVFWKTKDDKLLINIKSHHLKELYEDFLGKKIGATIQNKMSS